MKRSRRHFLKAGAALGAGSLISQRLLSATPDGIPAVAPALKQFGYGDVELLEGPLHEQFAANHAFYGALNEDSLLKPFRQRAGLPTPGEDMGGWYSWAPLADIDKPGNNGFAPCHSFGQYLSALARDYAATGNKRTQEKVHGIVRNFAPAITPDFWRDNRFPAYTYDKISIGLLDAHQFAQAPGALKALGKTLDSVQDHLPPGGISRPRNMRGRTRTNRSAGMSRTRCLKMPSSPGSAARATGSVTSAFDFWPTIGIGIPWPRDRMYCPASMLTAT